MSHADKIEAAHKGVLEAAEMDWMHAESGPRTTAAMDVLNELHQQTCPVCFGFGSISNPGSWTRCPAGCDDGKRRKEEVRP